MSKRIKHKELEKLILKLHYLMILSNSEKVRDAYNYVINELHLIKNGYGI